MLVAGGYNSTSGYVASTEVYDPATAMWTTTGALATARDGHTATLLPNGKVLVAGGYNSTSGRVASAEVYDPATGMWTTTGALATARDGHTAALLPSGKVLVAGGVDHSGNLLSGSEMYDPAAGTWSGTGALLTARSLHTTTLLPNGTILTAGGITVGLIYQSSAEVYDVGLGFSAFWQPQIATLTSPISLGSSLGMTGSQFRGISEGSGGNCQDSPSDYPLVQLRSLESGQTMFLLASKWSTNSFASLPVFGFPPGYAMATVLVNGIPSPSKIFLIGDSAGGGTSLQVNVPATADLWLAGMPDGSVSGWSAEYHVAPAESPIQVPSPIVSGGTIFTFSANGTAAYGPTLPRFGPDGSPTNIASHYPGAENGIANASIPFDALVGVFLDNNVPSGFPAPAALVFSTAALRDFTLLQPALRQPFFVGAGLTSAGFLQQFVAPTGATRLFLGVMDAYQWSNNVGGFLVNVATNSTLGLPPAITNYPTTLEVDPGQGASFTVGVTGTVPLSYQWQWNGTNLTDTSRVSGSQSNTLTIANTQVSDAGKYLVKIVNAYGSAIASPSLRVGPRPLITSQPQSQNVLAGADVSLSVAATSPTPLTYQWMKNWLAVESATNSSLVLSNVQTLDAGTYWVVVSNAGDLAYSANVRLTVTATNALVTPIALTGWNADVVFENAPHPFAQAFDGNSSAWFESGFNGYPDGLPTSRLISSAFNSNVLFQLQPYDANNVLSLPNKSASARTGTLTLVVPQAFKSLSVAAACGYGFLQENYGTMVLNFLDGSRSAVLAYRASDWWNYNPGSDPEAITGLECVATNAPLSGEQVAYQPGVGGA